MATEGDEAQRATVVASVSTRLFAHANSRDETAHGERKKLCGLTEKAGGEAAIKDNLIELVRSHYDKLEQIAGEVTPDSASPCVACDTTPAAKWPCAGDNYVGIDRDNEERLLFLKGEPKSGRAVPQGVVADARERLSENNGRPTTISVLFVGRSASRMGRRG